MALVKCNECGKDISSNASSCPNCGNPTNNKQYNNDNNTTAKIISFIFPIIGLIIYAINVNKNNKLAKDCLKFALMPIVIIGVLLVLVLVVGLIGSLFYRLKGNDRNNRIEQMDFIKSAREYVENNEIFYTCYNNEEYYITLQKLKDNNYIDDIDIKYRDSKVKVECNDNDFTFEFVE